MAANRLIAAKPICLGAQRPSVQRLMTYLPERCRPAVTEVLGNAFSPVQLSDEILVTQTSSTIPREFEMRPGWMHKWDGYCPIYYTCVAKV
jgi:hypothetical protein